MNKKSALLLAAFALLLIGFIFLFNKTNSNVDSQETLESPTSADKEPEIESPTFAPEQKIYTLSADGYGPAQIGMTVPEASEALKMPLSSNTPEQDESSCYYVYPYGEPGTVGFMVTENKIARVDVHFENPDIETERQIKFGSSTEDVKKAYGDVKVMPHPYGTADEKYLIYEAPNKNLIIFETDQNGNVTSFRSGKLPEVEFIEGCS